jgi:hypothetical protein
VRGAAVWALSRLPGDAAMRATMAARMATERDPDVLAEMELAGAGLERLAP